MLPIVKDTIKVTSLPPILQPTPLPRVNKKESAPLPRVPEQTSVLDKLKQKRWQRAHAPAKRYNLLSHLYPSSYKAKAAQTLLAQHIFTMPHINHIYDTNGKRLTVDNLLKGPQSNIWTKSLSMELGRLAQGNKYGVSSTDTITFIHLHEVPTLEKVTYAQCVCDHRPLKPEPYRISIVVGGDKLDCDIDAGAPATNLVEFKLLLNSVISE